MYVSGFVKVILFNDLFLHVFYKKTRKLPTAINENFKLNNFAPAHCSGNFSHNISESFGNLRGLGKTKFRFL